jgi:hypothetical protein
MIVIYDHDNPRDHLCLPPHVMSTVSFVQASSLSLLLAQLYTPVELLLLDTQLHTIDLFLHVHCDSRFSPSRFPTTFD